MRATVPIHRNDAVLAAVAEMRRAGLAWGETCARLRVSRNTYYRCLAEIDRRKGAPCQGDDDGDDD